MTKFPFRLGYTFSIKWPLSSTSILRQTPLKKGATPRIISYRNQVFRRILITLGYQFNSLITFAEYAEILPDTRPKILKLKFTSATNNIIVSVDKILDNHLTSEVIMAEFIVWSMLWLLQSREWPRYAQKHFTFLSISVLFEVDNLRNEIARRNPSQ